MAHDADVLILGGGCAGLSLAAALAERAPGLRVHVLEQRTAYTRDRTWCFWNTEPHPFESAVTHRWHSWQVTLDGRVARQHSGRYTYDHVPADSFYGVAERLMRRAGQQLSLGVDVRSVSEGEDGVRVDTSLGQLRGRWVFDSRPTEPVGRPTMLLQRFTGWHVCTERPCFTPQVADLMSFQPPEEPGRIPFLYVLPFSATEALVEATFLDSPEMPPADADAMLRGWLAQQNGGAYQVRYTEQGTLPMGQAPRPHTGRGRVVNTGIRGGRIKASSGYAFMRIQRQSRILAEALAAGRPMPRRYEPASFALLDRIFLHAIRRWPARAPEYFFQMFRRVPADVLVRFLSETASPAETVRVMLALPKLDFIGAALLPPAEAGL